MKHQYHERLKTFIQKEITETATELALTNEEVSVLLGVSSRNYSNIKSGKYSCSAETLSSFIVNMCTDKNKFLERLTEAVKEAENDL